MNEPRNYKIDWSLVHLDDRAHEHCGMDSINELYCTRPVTWRMPQIVIENDSDLVDEYQIQSIWSCDFHRSDIDSYVADRNITDPEYDPTTGPDETESVQTESVQTESFPDPIQWDCVNNSTGVHPAKFALTTEEGDEFLLCLDHMGAFLIQCADTRTVLTQARYIGNEI